MLLYRSVVHREHAEALINGYVRLGTLEFYRGCEGKRRGDPNEGTTTYHTGHASGDYDDADFVEIARRSGIHIGPGARGTVIRDCSRRQSVRDAFLLCTSLEPLTAPEDVAEFGEYIVQIRDIDLFAHRIGKALAKEFPNPRHKRGPVDYGGTVYRKLEPEPKAIAFVKDPEFATQREYRLLWECDCYPSPSEPITLHVPSVAGFCELIRSPRET